MSTAEVRDIIADGVFSHLPIDGTTPLYRAVDAILSALTAAGYRVVREGELDAATVERCALAADAFYYDHPVASAEIRDALRGSCWGSEMSLASLIAEVEKLTSPSREVDAAIYNAIVDDGGRVAFKVHNWATEPGCRLDRWHDGWLVGKSDTDKYAEELPRYSASIDAVVALIEHELPDPVWMVQTDWGGFCGAHISIFPDQMDGPVSFSTQAETAVTALLAAFLRAIEARAG